MTAFVSSAAGVLTGLVLGLLSRVFFETQIYPRLSARHEAAKVTMSQGIPPSQISIFVQLVTLIGFPLAGYFVLGPLFRALGGQ